MDIAENNLNVLNFAFNKASNTNEQCMKHLIYALHTSFRIYLIAPFTSLTNEFKVKKNLIKFIKECFEIRLT